MTAPGSFDSLTAPTIESAKVTFAAIKQTVDLVCEDCRTVCETLSSLGEALGVLTQGDSLDDGLSGASLVGLPMLAAVRAAKTIAGRYVAQQTGAPLDTWVDLVADASTQFEAYLGQLDTVDQIARRYHPGAPDAPDPAQTQEDLEILQQTLWQTRAWKQILGRVARLSQLVDAILQSRSHDGAGGPPEATSRATGFSASLQRRVQDVQARTVDKTGELREWVLQPFVEIRDRVTELPAQTQRLSGQIENLEILLDLEVVTIRACAGEIPQAAARVIGIRVAASVVLPDLVLRLRATRGNVLRFENFLARLEAARHGGNIHERVYAVLSDEYRTGLQSSRAELEALDARAQAWRAGGPAVLAACADWLAVELDILAARTLIEQQEPPGDRRRLLHRERQRLDEARALLASL
jgi:hypothetical protein